MSPRQAQQSAVEQPLGSEHGDQQSPYLDAVAAAAYMKFPNVGALYAFLYRHPRFPRLRKGRRLLFDTRVMDAFVRGDLSKGSVRVVHGPKYPALVGRK